MLRPAPASLLLAILTLAPAAAAQVPKKLDATLGVWLARYRQGKLPVGDDYLDIAGKSLVRRAGIITKTMFQRDNGVLKRGQFSHRDELPVLLEAAAAANTEAITLRLLEYSAVGLDNAVRYTPAMVPFFVRTTAEASLANVAHADPAWLARVARGSLPARCKPALRSAVRAAALRALAQRRGSTAAAVEALGTKGAVRSIRLAAIEALGRSADPASLGPLVRHLPTEADPLARQHCHVWIARLISSVQHKVDPAQGTRAAELYAQDLRAAAPSWHTTAALVELVRVHAVPATAGDLVGILDRAAAGTLRHLAHDQLRSITGADLPLDAAAWRAHWAKIEKGFTFRPPAATPPKDAAGPFFGIPVRGSRVVFVLDTGAGMQKPLLDGKTNRLAAVRRALKRTLASLPVTTTFNVLAFSDRTKAAFKKLTPATKTTLAKARAFAERLKPRRNHDLGTALTTALGLDTIPYAAPGGPVDEVFIVSCHMNQAGPIKAPDDLIAMIENVRRFSRVRIHTVYLGDADDVDDPDELGRKTMERIAALADGRSVRR